MKKKKYLFSDKQYCNIHQINVLLSLTMKEKPEKCQFRPFFMTKNAHFLHRSISNKEFIVATTCTTELVSG